jgi:hypothetical protein
VACPFFMPVEKLQNGTWLHATRLPLGCGWSGHCTAPAHEGEAPSQEELRDYCNLGYADGCARLPRERVWDSVRFGARTLGTDEKSNGEKNPSARRIRVRYVCERGHRPAEHGSLEFDTALARWTKPHSNRCVQRMAECFLESYIETGKNHETVAAAS